MNQQLDTLPNIGKTLAEKLAVIGIDSQDALKLAGAEDVFIKMKTIDNTACINMLYAIEGAIQGIRWHHLDKGRKRELLEFYNSLDKMV